MTYDAYIFRRDTILMRYEMGAISEEEFLQQTKELDKEYEGK